MTCPVDLWPLTVFCKVVEQRSFSRAGRRLHLSQPTVSSHIKALEDHFACRLIDRMAREAVPTKAGELLYGYARRMLSLRDEAESAVAEFQGAMRGRLVIGGSTIPGTYLLPRLVGRFTANHPQIAVTVLIGSSAAMLANILDGTVELGIVGARAEHKALRQHDLYRDELRLIVPAGHRWAGRSQVDLSDLGDEPFILRESGSGTRRAFEDGLARCRATLDQMTVVAEMGSTEAVKQGVRHGVGVSVMSALAVADEVAGGHLAALAVAGLDLRRRFFLTEHRDRSASPIGRAFGRFLKQDLLNQGGVSS